MSSVEIRIKGIKNVKGIKTKRGKARRKINKKKEDLKEKKKMEEYSYSVSRPYNYTSPIIPTYITRPEITQQQQQQLPLLDKLDKLALSLQLAKDKTDTVKEQNIYAPSIPYFPQQSSMSIDFSMPDEEKQKLENQIIEERNIAREALEKAAVEEGARIAAEEQAQVLGENVFKDIKKALSQKGRKKSSSKVKEGNIKDYYPKINK